MPERISILKAAAALGFVENDYGSPTFIHPLCTVGLVHKVISPVVVLMGHYNTGRTLGFIENNLPETVESPDQLKALLAFYLNEAIPMDRPKWLDEGLALSHLLPWSRDAL